MPEKSQKKLKINPNVSVDCVVFGYSNETLKVLLIKRKAIENVSTEQLALPGDLVQENESLDEAAEKILFNLLLDRKISINLSS